MTDELPPAQRIKLSWLIGVVAAFAIFVLIAGYSARMANDTSDYDQERAEVRKDNLKKVQEAENKLLEPAELDKDGKPTGKVTAEWVDQAKGTVRIPIEDAMAKQVEVLKARPVAIGGEILGTAPAKPAPTPATTNAAPAAPAPAAPVAPAPAAPTNSAPAKPVKPKKAASNPPSAKPDDKVKPASPAAATSTPTVPEKDAPNK